MLFYIIPLMILYPNCISLLEVCLYENFFKIHPVSHQNLPNNIFSQTVNKNTGEHNCVMVSPVSTSPDLEGDNTPSSPQWVNQCSEEFMRRFIELLGGPLRNLHPMLAYNVIKTHHTLKESEEPYGELQYISCYRHLL